MTTTLSERCDRAAARIVPDIVQLAEDLRRDPELSGHERRSSARCGDLLAAHGFAVTFGTAGLPTAFVARRVLGAGATRVAFLAEYDALPGIGHGCGHHLIAAAGVGAGIVAALAGDELVAALAGGELVAALAGAEAVAARVGAEAVAASGPGDGGGLEIRVIGTPSEETIGGKVLLAEAGLFDDCDGVLMVHAGHEWRTVTDSLACQSVEVVFGGKASHAVAAPEAGINALDAMIDLFVAVRALRARFSPATRMPGIIKEGGMRANIVPDRAAARFSARAPSAGERDAMIEALIAEVETIARAHGCRSLVRPVDNPYDAMQTNMTLARALRDELEARGGSVNDAPRKGKGSIDAGNVSLRAPTVHGYMPVAPISCPLHSREFADATSGEACAGPLGIASAAMGTVALRLAQDPMLRSETHRERAAIVAPSTTRRWPLLVEEPEEQVAC